MSCQIDIQLTKNKKYAGQHPYFNSGESLGLGGVWIDVIEDVDKNKKEGNQKRHSRKKYVFFVIHTLIIYFPNICFVFWWLLQCNILSYITCQVQCLEESEKISRRLPRTNLQNTTIQFLLSASYNSHLMASSRWWYRTWSASPESKH